jgi:ABC-type uncharacterized transport system permease subunit
VAALALALCALVVWAAGRDPVEAAQALFWGAFGSPVRWSETLSKAIPLAMTGLGVALCFRAGFWNIGAEGQFLIGALAATWMATRVAAFWPLVLLCGALGGAAWALVAGGLKLKRGAPEIITTIMLNYIALQLVAFSVQGPLQERERTQPQSDLFPPGAQLPALIPDTTLHIGLFAALGCALGAWWLLFRSRRGFEWRASGANPQAARAGLIAVEKRTLEAVALGGALGGLGGAMEIAGATKQLGIGGFGYGYTAIAVALLANTNPLQVLAAALLFGALNAGGGAMERVAGVPAVTVSVVTGVTLLAVAILGRARRS